MKKVMMCVLLATVSSLVMAGGDIVSYPDEEMPEVTCKANDVYVDYKEKLMWQDAPYGDTEDRAYKNNKSAGKAGNWEYANNYCNELNYAGQTGWRLPKVGELSHLYAKKNKLKNNIAQDFWTSTPDKGNKYLTIYAILEGQTYKHKKSDSHYIRCVRCL